MLIIVLEMYIDLDHILFVSLPNKSTLSGPVIYPDMISKINHFAGTQTDVLEITTSCMASCLRAKLSFPFSRPGDLFVPLFVSSVPFDP